MGLFGKSKQPAVQKAEPAPSVDDARTKVANEKAARARRGSVANILVGEETAASTGAVKLGN